MSERIEGQRDGRAPGSDADEARRSALPPPWPRSRRWPISLLLGLLLGLAYGLHVRDNRLFPLAYVSTLPWLLLCLHPRLHGRFNLVSLGLGCQLLFLVGCSFLRAQGTASWLVAPLLYWPAGLLTWPLCRALQGRWPRLPPVPLWPLVFTGVEWLGIRLCPGELSLWNLAYSQARLPRILQLAELGGTGLVSFYLSSVVGLLGAFVLAPSLFRSAAERRRWLLPQLSFVLALAIFAQVFGALRDSEASFRDGPLVQIVQTNTPRSRDPEQVRRILDRQLLQTYSTLRPGEADLILWPENSLMTPIRDGAGWDERSLADLRRLVERAGAPLLFDSGWIGDEGESYHAAFLLGLDGSLQKHLKVRLLPWTEYAPLSGFFRLFGDRAAEAWRAFIARFVGFVPDGTQAPLEDVHPMLLRCRDGRTLRLGTPICFEIATARVVNRWHRQGVDLLVNPASEASLGDAIHRQTLGISAFRAVEGRVPVVRVTNDGISGVIDSNGRPRAILRGRYSGSPVREAGVLFARVPLDWRGPTAYARFADWLPAGCLAIALTLALFALVVRWRGRG